MKNDDTVTHWKFIGIFIKVIKNKPFSLFWTTMNRQTDYVVLK